MKNKIFILAAIAALFLGSCAKEQLVESSEIVKQENPHLIPVSEAVASLDSFLSEIEEETTKSGVTVQKRRIRDVKTVYSSSVYTKSSSDEENDVNELLYIVDFENNQGYAILSADDRIGVDILAVYDNGNSGSSGISRAPSRTYDVRLIYDGYPKDGPGIIVDEDGDKYLNPNTFSLYDESIGEYLVGDITVQGRSSSTGIGSGSSSGSGPGSSKFGDRILDYVGDKISKDDGDLHEDVKKPIDNPGDTGNEDKGRVETYKGPYERDVVVMPMLAFAKSWHQSSPFNDWFKKVKNKDTKRKENAAAGCVPLALAKILCYNDYPETISYGGVTVTMSHLKTSKIDDPGFNGQAASLLKYIAEECGSWYFREGTFTFPFRAKNFLKDSKYSGVAYDDYSTDSVLQSLDLDKPVFVCSIPKTDKKNYDLGKSHAWMIDGYMKRTQTTTHYRYRNNKLETKWTSTSSNTMVHCDFGWGGESNGYFTSGIFDFLDNENTEFDNTSDKGKKVRDYKWYLKTIIYDKPL